MTPFQRCTAPAAVLWSSSLTSAHSWTWTRRDSPCPILPLRWRKTPAGTQSSTRTGARNATTSLLPTAPHTRCRRRLSPSRLLRVQRKYPLAATPQERPANFRPTRPTMLGLPAAQAVRRIFNPNRSFTDPCSIASTTNPLRCACSSVRDEW